MILISVIPLKLSKTNRLVIVRGTFNYFGVANDGETVTVMPVSIMIAFNFDNCVGYADALNKPLLGPVVIY